MTTRVLVVEDDATLRRAIARRLATEGASVTQAASTADADRVDSRFEFGVFDIVLPDGNGIDVAARLLSGGKVGKAVFFTGLRDDSALERAATFGTVVRKGNENPLDELVQLTLDRVSWPPFEACGPSTADHGSGLRVRFLPGRPGSLSVLEIRSPRRSSVLPMVRGLLFDMRVQIMRAESKVLRDRLTERLHMVEFDGAPISRQRHLQIQMAVLGLLADSMQSGNR